MRKGGREKGVWESGEVEKARQWGFQVSAQWETCIGIVSNINEIEKERKLYRDVKKKQMRRETSNLKQGK